ncbi:MAG: ATP-binding protein [Bryobacterales bacterium]|nr:ATP-binding protein [Bryobacterales bacterium]
MKVAAEVAITEPTHVAEARRVSLRLAKHLEFDDDVQARLAVVVTEIATNVLKHAGRGKVLVSPVCHDHRAALDVYGFDAGPGIPNLMACLRDGYSTAGSSGTGLGAIARMSDDWDVFTGPQSGTVIRARCGPKAAAPRTPSLEVGGITLPMNGDPDSGDSWVVRSHSPDSLSMLMVDGLGHGYGAAQAANAAVDIFLRKPALSGVALMEELHAGLRTTRGAAVASVEASLSAGTLQFTGVGNISGVVHDGSAAAQHLVSMNGIVGHRLSKLREFSYPWTAGSVLVLHSDGLRNRWTLGSYPGLQARSAALIAGVLMRDHSRGTDDSSVAVAVQRSSHVS